MTLFSVRFTTSILAAALLLGVSVYVTATTTVTQPATGLTLLAVCALAFVCVAQLSMLHEIRANHSLLDILTMESDLFAGQKKLMQASGQELPDKLRVTKTAVLYGALIAEEVGETLVALSDLFAKAAETHKYDAFNLAIEYARTGHWMIDQSRQWRERIEFMPDSTFDGQELKPADFVGFLDGLCDTVVVVAGAAHSAGLPIAQAYAEVMSSNLSKIDPASNTILKTRDGKWIKGLAFAPPDLETLLSRVHKLP